MADQCYCCSCAGSMRDNMVVIRGLGKGVNLDDVELFVESSRFCPIGGDVEDIERISEDSALVTFCDSQVATGLIGNSLTMPDGTVLCVQSIQTIDHKQPDLCADQNETDRDKDKSNGSTRENFSGSSGSERNKSSDEDNSARRNGGNIENGEDQSTKSTKEETKRNKRHEQRKDKNRSKRNSDSKSNSAENFKEKKDAETQNEFSDQENAASKRAEVEEISFSLEKLKLIRLVLDFTSKPLSNVKFDENSQTVNVHGTRDEIETAKLQLYEIANNAVDDTIHIPEQSEELALSARVESWLSEEFSSRQLAAVCCDIGDKSSILAKDEETLKSACELLADILVTEKLNFDGSQRSYLRTLGWTEYVEAAESSRVVSITTEDSSSVVMVTGYVSDVSECVKEVRELLRANTSTTHDMRCEKRVVYLLKSQANAITAAVSQVASSTVQLDFHAEGGVIKLTGLESDLKETIKLLEENFISAVRHERYEVDMPGLTIEMFTKKPSAGCDLVDLLQLKYNCVIEVGEKSGRHEDDFESQHRRRRDKIQVIQGDIVKFQTADVLVNTVAKRESSVMRCFLKAGGEQLDQELRRIGMPSSFGNDVVVTGACEELKAKFIFHAAIGNYRNEESTDRMYRLIKKCLEMAVKHEAKSIAFPTLGCGRLGFRTSQVVDCFLKAIEKSHSDLVIFVIALGDDVAKKFRSHITRVSSSRFSDDSKGKVTGRGRGRTDGRKHVTASDAIAFHISALSDDIIQEVKEALGQRIIDLTSETPIHDKAIAKLSDEAISSIRKLQSQNVFIEIDKKKKTITVKGEKSAASETKLKICSIIYKDWAKRIARNNVSRVPEYWSKYKNLRHVQHGSGCARVRLSPRSVWYKEVSRLVTKTWEDDKVGQGNDAAGLGPHRIRIRNIFCIENPRLYSRYMTKRQGHCLVANRNPCPKINELLHERRIQTSNLKLRNLEATLSRNVNECFLLHGTKEEIVDSIQAQGLDSRLSESDAMFGVGTYFTESSTKADQYADSKKQRVPDGQSMYMYVCRVLLGSPFICQTPTRFRRPPCQKRGCFSDSCTGHKNVGSFDSVIGTHKSGNVRLIFREFIIYHPDQSYPDFLVEYERKSV